MARTSAAGRGTAMASEPWPRSMANVPTGTWTTARHVQWPLTSVARTVRTPAAT